MPKTHVDHAAIVAAFPTERVSLASVTWVKWRPRLSTATLTPVESE